MPCLPSRANYPSPNSSKSGEYNPDVHKHLVGFEAVQQENPDLIVFMHSPICIYGPGATGGGSSETAPTLGSGGI